MKHNQLFPLLLCFALSYSSHAQYFERNLQPDTYNDVTEMRSTNDGLLYCLTSTDLKPNFIHRIDQQGNTVSIYILTYSEVLDFDWLPLTDGIILTGHYFDCDVILPRRYSRYDTSGNLLWENSTDPWSSGAFTDTVKLLPGPGGNTYWTFDGGKPRLYDSNGDSIGAAPYALPRFTGYFGTADDRLFTFGSGVALYNTDLTTVQFGLADITVQKAGALPDGRFVLLTPDQLLIINSDFEIVQAISHGIQAGTGTPPDMAVHAAEIRLLTNTAPNQLLRFDTLLALQETLNIPTDATFQPKLLTTDDQRLVLAGAEYNVPANSVVAVRSTPLNAPYFDASPDAALTGLVSAQLPVGYYDAGWNVHYIDYDSVTVVLKNEGADTLRDVWLNAVIGYYYFACTSTEYYRTHFSDLDLAPGESVHLEVGKFTQYAPYTVPPVATLCFWTTLPNDSLDQNRLNNSVCEDFTVIIGTDEPKKVLPLHILPNPAADFFLLQWPGKPDAAATVRLYDVTGRIVMETGITGSEWRVQRENLAAGFYQVVLTDENGWMYSGKIVLE